MSRKIVIENCGECPHKGHKGAFGRVAYVPRCGKTGKDLPYTKVVGATDSIHAQYTGVIPDWCPLELDE